MRKLIYNPHDFKSNFAYLFKKVAQGSSPITIQSEKDSNNVAVLVSKKDWEKMKNHLYLAQSDADQVVSQRFKRGKIQRIHHLKWKIDINS